MLTKNGTHWHMSIWILSAHLDEEFLPQKNVIIIHPTYAHYLLLHTGYYAGHLLPEFINQMRLLICR